MARPKVGMCTRQVTARFWDNEELAELEHSSGQPKLRLTMIGLWAASDAAGRFEWRPRMLAPKIYPFFPEDQALVEACMNLFIEYGYLLKYQVDGKTYGAWPHWGEHNDFRERKSVYPAHPGHSGVSRGNKTPNTPQNEEMECEVEVEGEVENNAMAAELPTGTATLTSFSSGNGKGNTVQSTEPQPTVDPPLPCYSHSVRIDSGTPQPNCNKCANIKFWIGKYGRTTTTPVEVTVPVGTKEDGVISIHATNFAKLLYQALPSDKQENAATNWQELWAADIQGLINEGESPDMIEKVLRALPRLARLKYVYRGDSFVSRYNDLVKDVVKLGKKQPSVMEEVLAKKARGSYK